MGVGQDEREARKRGERRVAGERRGKGRDEPLRTGEYDCVIIAVLFSARRVRTTPRVPVSRSAWQRYKASSGRRY